MVATARVVLTGSVLHPSSRRLLTGWLVTSTRGTDRLRAGLPATWRVGTKAGTGARGATNDVGDRLAAGTIADPDRQLFDRGCRIGDRAGGGACRRRPHDRDFLGISSQRLSRIGAAIVRRGTMLDIRPLNDRFAVAPQIAPEDVAAIAAAGYVAIINNRPDDEEPGQPGGRRDPRRGRSGGAGLYGGAGDACRHRADRSSTPLAAAITAADGPVLAYCRSGTRSCHLWALAAARAGRDPALLVAQAAAAGYDLSRLARRRSTCWRGARCS